MGGAVPNQRIAVITENNVPTFRRPFVPTYMDGRGLSNRVVAMGNKLLAPTRERRAALASFLPLRPASPGRFSAPFVLLPHGLVVVGRSPIRDTLKQ